MVLFPDSPAPAQRKRDVNNKSEMMIIEVRCTWARVCLHCRNVGREADDVWYMKDIRCTDVQNVHMTVGATQDDAYNSGQVWYFLWKRCCTRTTLQQNLQWRTSMKFKPPPPDPWSPLQAPTPLTPHPHRLGEPGGREPNWWHHCSHIKLRPPAYRWAFNAIITPTTQRRRPPGWRWAGISQRGEGRAFFFVCFFCFCFLFFCAFLKVALFVPAGVIWRRASFVSCVTHPVRPGTLEALSRYKDVGFRNKWIQVHRLQEETSLRPQTISWSLWVRRRRRWGRRRSFMWLKLKRALHCPCVLQLQTHLGQIITILRRPSFRGHKVTLSASFQVLAL